MAILKEQAQKRKAMEDAAAAYRAAVQLTFEEILKTTKDLIARHEFKAAGSSGRGQSPWTPVPVFY